MSTNIKTKMINHTLTEFYGGSDRGVCIQVSAHLSDIDGSVIEQLQREGHIVLTMEEAYFLYNDLRLFILREAKRRQKLLRDQLNELKINERTVMHEIAEIPAEISTGGEIVIEMISKICPKARNE